MKMRPLENDEVVPTPYAVEKPGVPAVGSRSIEAVLKSLDEEDLVQHVTEIVGHICGFEVQVEGSEPRFHKMVADLSGGTLDKDQLRRDIFHGKFLDLHTLPDDILLDSGILPTADFEPGEDLKDWVRGLLCPNLDARTSKLYQKYVGINIVGHAGLLSDVRESDPEAWSLLRRFDCGAAMALGRPFKGIRSSRTRELIATHALLLCAFRARLRIALLRRWRTLPMGDHFRLDVETLYQKRVWMDQFVLPSRDIIAQLQVQVAEGASPGFRWVGPNAPPSLLNDSFFLRVAEAAARQVFGPMIGAEALRKARYDIEQWLTSTLQPIAATTNADLAAQGLGLWSFVEDRIGVTASQGSVIVAMWLVEARTRIEACMLAIETKTLLPSTAATSPSFARQVENAYKPMVPKWVTEGLRRMGKPDHNCERKPRGFDVDNHPSFQLVQKTLDAFAVSCPDKAVRALMIDPADMFA